MLNRRLLLLSNSTNFGEPFLQYPKAHIQEFLGSKVSQLLFIPYAAVGFSYDLYASKVNEALSSIGVKVESIHTHPNPVDAVMNAQAIAVGGGNTFELLNLLYKNQLIEPIRSRVESGMPYIGWSAGSNVASPTIKTTNDMPISEPPSFEALNLIPFQLNPHYTEEKIPNHGGEGRKDRINEFIVLNPQTVVGIAEGNLLEVNGSDITLIGPDDIKVFKGGQEITSYDRDSDLSFLLNS